MRTALLVVCTAAEPMQSPYTTQARIPPCAADHTVAASEHCASGGGDTRLACARPYFAPQTTAAASSFGLCSQPPHPPRGATHVLLPNMPTVAMLAAHATTSTSVKGIILPRVPAPNHE